jgi:heptosyltransferase-2
MSGRLLVIQTAFLGDAVLSLPFLYRLAERHPQARVTLVATGAGHELFRVALTRGLAPYAERIELVKFDKRGADAGLGGGRRFARRLRGAEGFDAAFCLQRSFRSGLIALLAGARTRVGFSSGAASYLYTIGVRREWETGRSEIEKNLDLLRAWESENGREPLGEWDPHTAPSLLSDGRTRSTEPIVALSLGSPWATKRWPVENAIPLIEQLVAEGVEVRLLGDAQATEFSAAIRERVPSLLLKDLAGKTSIAEWVDALADVDAVVSGDSAAVHAASDLNVPVVALFGPTLPDFGFAPWRRNSWVLGAALDCRPCHIHGPQVCPLGHHRCLRDIRAEHVWRRLAPIVDRQAGTG